MKITILGCGTSSGVPVIGCDCKVCSSDLSRNKRTRVSALIESENTRVLVDTSPDLRSQLLQAGVTKIDAVLYTHAHADHVHGIDDLRSINFLAKTPIRAYGSSETLKSIKERFNYAFINSSQANNYTNYWSRPAIISNELPNKNKGKFKVGGLNIEYFEQSHGKLHTTGYIFNSIAAYSTDFNHIDMNALTNLRYIPLWVLDCLGYDEHPTHSNLSNTLSYIECVKPKLAVLTHMSHQLDYQILQDETPPNVVPGYDGMVINIPESY